MTNVGDIASQVEAIYLSESRRVLATLIRLLGDFAVAEDAMHEAFRAALEQWAQEGLPNNPGAWLISAGRFKAIDKLRRQARFEAPLNEAGDPVDQPVDVDDQAIHDDQLRLIFTCCHPALPPEARTAMTLREFCGLKTEEIARVFLVSPVTLAQRIVRAKNKIRDDKIPYQVPSPSELPERLDAVLQVIYLMFNEGYSASAGDALTRPDLSAEAVRLGRLLLELLPEPEVMGLLAMMLLHESRRAARTTPDGDLVLLDQQDRSLWNRSLIEEGVALVERAFAFRRLGPYTLQAAISALHAEAPSTDKTDWAEIAALYHLLMRIHPSPVVELNRAVAVAMRDGPAAGLAIVDNILARGDLQNYYLSYSVRADLYRRLGRKDEARSDYQRALSLTQQGPEQRFLERRLQELK